MERPNPRCKKTTFEKNKISHSELTSIINGLEKLEGYVGEEYLTILHAKTVESIAQEPSQFYQKISKEPLQI